MYIFFMNWLDMIPPKKEFIKDFLLDGKIYMTIKYDQATIGEFYEFYYKSEDDKSQELLNFIRSHIPYTLWQKIRKKINKKYLTIFEKNLDLDKISTEIMETRFRTIDSIYKGTEKYDTRKKGNKKALWRTTLARVCQFWHLSLSELINNYTLEQLIRLIDWVIYDWNLSSKEWEFVNNMALKDKDGIKSRLEENKKLFGDK